jgi:hypothetical protein
MGLRHLLFAFALASCVLNSTYTPTGDAPASTRAPADVEVLVGVQPQRTFAQRGVIRISGNADASAMIAEAKQAGADNGCDAVVLTLASDTRRDVTTGACIVYTAPK